MNLHCETEGTSNEATGYVKRMVHALSKDEENDDQQWHPPKFKVSNVDKYNYDSFISKNGKDHIKNKIKEVMDSTQMCETRPNSPRSISSQRSSGSIKSWRTTKSTLSTSSSLASIERQHLPQYDCSKEYYDGFVKGDEECSKFSDISSHRVTINKHRVDHEKRVTKNCNCVESNASPVSNTGCAPKSANALIEIRTNPGDAPSPWNSEHVGHFDSFHVIPAYSLTSPETTSCTRQTSPVSDFNNAEIKAESCDNTGSTENFIISDNNPVRLRRHYWKSLAMANGCQAFQRPSRHARSRLVTRTDGNGHDITEGQAAKSEPQDYKFTQKTGLSLIEQFADTAPYHVQRPSRPCEGIDVLLEYARDDETENNQDAWAFLAPRERYKIRRLLN